MTPFPKYPKYKDSGVEWLGDVPEHWEVRRNLGIFDERKEANLPNAELLSVTQDRGIIRQSEITVKKDSSNDDKTKYKVVKVGDLAYNKMRAWQGALGISTFDGIVSPAYVVLTPRNPKLSKFFHYLFRTNEFITEANRLSYGLCGDMNSLRYEHFKTSYSVIPPDRDIDRIVAFLDEKTAEIDTLIAKKQRQIELLDEQKAILINRAVTRGLAPQAELQDSDIPWIGPIPKHWQIRKLGAVVSFVSGATPSKDRNDFWNGGVPWISPKDMKRLRIDSSEDTITPAALKHTNIKLLPPGTVLIVVRGMILARTVPIGLNTVPATINQDIKGMDVNQMVMSPEYLLTMLTACQDMLTPLIEESGHGTRCLRTESLKTVMIPTPPRHEQDELVIRVQAINDASTSAKSKLESQIQTLQTLRSTLIAHAVTGKIKV